MKAVLALENGQWFDGVSVGAPARRLGEVGVQHQHDRLPGSAHRPVLRRPDRHHDLPADRQLRRHAEDAESTRTEVAGFIVRESSPWPATGARKARCATTCGQRSRGHRRHRHARADPALRSAGVMRASIATGDRRPADSLVERAKASPEHGRARPGARGDLQAAVRLTRPSGGGRESGASSVGPPPRHGGRRLRGRGLRFRHEVEHPARAWPRTAATCACPGHARRRPSARAASPTASSLSNGPGDPAALDYVVDTREAASAGCRSSASAWATRSWGWPWAARTYKLKFGHRGANHPVKHLATGQVEITSRTTASRSMPSRCPRDVEVTHLNLNDGTVEGLRHRECAGLLRAVPPRGLARAARRRLPVRTVPGGDGEAGIGHQPGARGPGLDIPSSRVLAPGFRLRRQASRLTCPSDPTSIACSSSAPGPS